MDRPLQVLLVEDSEQDAQLVMRALRTHGYELAPARVETADEMNAALDAQAWDAIIADYSLPQFSGPAALGIAQERGLDLPFILVSGTVGEVNAIAAMKAGAHDFVLKHSLIRLGPAVERELREAEGRRQRKRAETSLRILADVSKLLTDAPDHRSVLRGAVDLVVPALADWCILYSIGESSITDTIETAHADGERVDAVSALADQYRPILVASNGADDPVTEVLRRRKAALFSEVTPEVIDRIARDRTHRRQLEDLELRSLILLPLLVRDQLKGLWVFASTHPGRYTDEDLGLAQEMAGRIALVSENARLYRAREAFISTAVHEIKTPVATIKLAVQLLQQLQTEGAAPQVPALLSRLERQCNRLTRLVTDVLEVTRIEIKSVSLTTRRTDLAALVDEVVAAMRSVSPDHEIAWVRPEPAFVDVDPGRIEQVVSNIINNAIKYSPGGGPIEVELRCDPESAVVLVRDRGVGIPKDKQGRVFERFYRAHTGTPYEHTASLGVGLYLSRELVTRHRGEIGFDSTEGEGSTFWFSLPLAPPSHDQQPLESSSGAEANGPIADSIH